MDAGLILFGIFFLFLAGAMAYQTYKTRNKDTWLLLLFSIALFGMGGILLWRGLV